MTLKSKKHIIREWVENQG